MVSFAAKATAAPAIPADAMSGVMLTFHSERITMRPAMIIIIFETFSARGIMSLLSPVTSETTVKPRYYNIF
jgi:hypothetical protein